MASPYVAGVVGLMLSLNPKLTAAQINGIIQRTSRPLPGSGLRMAERHGFRCHRCAGLPQGGRAHHPARRRSHQEAADMKIEVFPSASGDCVLVTSRDDKRLLADAGLPNAYDDFIATPLAELRKQQKAIDVAYVSHIDRDHIGGILRMLDHEVKWRVFEHMKKKEPDVQTAQGPEAAGGARDLAQRVPGKHRQDRSVQIRPGAGGKRQCASGPQRRRARRSAHGPARGRESRCWRSASATQSK